MNPLLEKSKEESTRVTVLDRGEIFATFLCKERAVTQSSCSRNENISPDKWPLAETIPKFQSSTPPANLERLLSESDAFAAFVELRADKKETL